MFWLMNKKKGKEKNGQFLIGFCDQLQEISTTLARALSILWSVP